MLPEKRSVNEPERVLRQACAELDRRLRGGEPCCAEDLFPTFPGLQNDAESALELIYTEFVLRTDLGQEPKPAEWYRRFPQWRERLERLFEVHEQWSAGGNGDTEAELATPYSPSSTGHPETQESEDRPVGPYELLEEIEHGGMGVVYKARQVGLNRLVALKMLLAGSYAGPEERLRFRREAEAAARLQHPNIAQIYEVGERDGLPFLALEFVAGGSLAKKLAGTPLPDHQAARLLETLARAMHYAHEHGIIHRDLKPANILLQKSEAPSPKSEKETDKMVSDLGFRISDFSPKITDFGLAKQLSLGPGASAGGGQTQTGAILGTPSYMAPEQAEGRLGHIGPATDIYALGAILYELVTGRPPFQAASMLEVLEQVRTQEPVPPCRLQPKLPRDLETICLKCLQKEPPKRYPSALDLAEDLHRFQAGEPIQARPTGRVERGVKWARRRPALAVLGAAVTLLLLVVVIGAPLSAFSWRQQRDQALHNEERAETAEQEVIEKLYASYLDQAEIGRWSRQAGQRFKGLDALTKASQIRQSVPGRNAAIACLALPDLKIVKQWPWLTPTDYIVAFDPLLERYAFKDPRFNISVRRVADDREVVSLPSPARPAWVFWLKFSSDGRYLAAVFTFAKKTPQAVVWDVLSGIALLNVPSAASGVCLDFSPDSLRVAIGGANGSIGIFEGATGKELSRLEKSCTPHTITFDPTGSLLAVASEKDQVLEIRSVDKDPQVATRFPHPGGVSHSAWRGDGKLLVTGCYDKNVYVWDMTAHRQHAVLRGHKGPVTFVAFNHEGDWLASASWDGTTKLWDPVSGGNLLNAPGFFLRFSRDDQHLAFGNSNQLGIWEVAGRRECRTLHLDRVGGKGTLVDNGGPWHVDWSSKGQLLSVAGEDGVLLLDSATGRELARLPTGWTESALFHPDATSLVTYGKAGLHRWPIQPNPEETSSRIRENSAASRILTNSATNPKTAGRPDQNEGFQIGPPLLLKASASSQKFRAALSHDGRMLGWLDWDHSQITVLNVEAPSQRVVLQGVSRGLGIALSPDGHWVAAGKWRVNDPAIQVWDVSAGKRVWGLPSTKPGANSSWATFSPDGKWLVSGEEDKFRFWEVGSWQPGPVVARERLEPRPGPLAFSSDSRILAIASSLWTVQLIDPDTGRVIAALAAPDPQQISWLCFSPDGSQLAVATENHLIQIWDLRLIRRQLREMDLDWDPPLFPPANNGDSPFP